MRIRARQHILDTWRATVAYSYRDGQWQWGGRSGRNSISDAEQLLTILYPATTIPSLRIDQPDRIADDVKDALRGLGNELDIPRVLVKVLVEYLEYYRDESGTPTFAGGSYFVTPSDPDEIKPEQYDLDVVDAFSMSVTLALVAIGFARTFRTGLRNATVIRETQLLEQLASQRLTASMVGLLRSFTVNVFDPDSTPGRIVSSVVNQTNSPESRLTDELLDSLEEIRASLREELTIGSGQVADELENPGRLFECGWSWGIVTDAPEIDRVKKTGAQPAGVAEARPYLYFTAVALDGIQDLFSERTRVLGLLDEDQQWLAQALQLRWSWAQEFWTKIATFGYGRWPLEDLPWRTSDGAESEYYTLMISSMVLQGLAGARESGDLVVRVGSVLSELASRGRITRRQVAGDYAIQHHLPGMRLRLIGSERLGESRLNWVVSSYSALLLKRVITVASLLADTVERQAMIDLADKIWDHLLARRLKHAPGRDLWDQPADVFQVEAEPFSAPSWYHTERIMESLVVAANMVTAQPLVHPRLAEIAGGTLAEAEHLFDQELLQGTKEAGSSMRTSFQTMESNLHRARDLLRARPATALILASDVLRDLDRLAAARQNLTRLS
ncbi:MAG TPA: SCO2524 family protein [Mycobacteriales bacterium]|nr:SCO2524 family protein [Mycobacteriales bacterium]